MDERIFANKALWQLWTWCLMMANHSDKTWMPISKGRGGQIEVEVNRGQFVFGRNSAAKSLKDNPSTIWKRMLKLKKLQFLDIISNMNYSVITICNYDEMFSSMEEKEHVLGEEQEKNRRRIGEDFHTTKNLKNLKNLKKGKEVMNAPNDKSFEAGSNGLDPNLKIILEECKNLSLVATGESSDFWDRVLGACEPYPIANDAWLFGKIRQWDQWFASNPGRKSTNRKRLESRLFAWLNRDLERLARIKQ